MKYPITLIQSFQSNFLFSIVHNVDNDANMAKKMSSYWVVLLCHNLKRLSMAIKSEKIYLFVKSLSIMDIF